MALTRARNHVVVTGGRDVLMSGMPWKGVVTAAKTLAAMQGGVGEAAGAGAVGGGDGSAGGVEGAAPPGALVAGGRAAGVIGILGTVCTFLTLSSTYYVIVVLCSCLHVSTQ